MSIPDLIRKHIGDLSPEVLFTSRDFLCYGKRSTVDNALSAMVKAGEINRVTRGVFASSKRTKPVTVLEVATEKARSFGRQIITHVANIAGKLGLLSESNSEHYFATDGRTSSFRFGSVVIHFKGTSLRRMSLGDSPAGQAIRTLCYLGKERFSADLVELVTRSLKHSERTEIGRLCAFMPAWLSSFFCSWYQPKQEATAESKIADYPVREQKLARNCKSEDLSVHESTLVNLAQIYSSMLLRVSDHAMPRHKALALQVSIQSEDA